MGTGAGLKVPSYETTLPPVGEAEQPKPRLVIRSNESFLVPQSFRDAWDRRELVYMLALRDLKLRYKQTALGAVWTVLQPLITTGVFSLVFGKVANLGSDGVPYPIFCFAALLPWNYFAMTLSRCSNSLLVNAPLLNKLYVPRVLVPISALLPGLADLMMGAVVLAGLCAYYHRVPTWSFFLAGPMILATIIMFVLGLGLILGALNVRYRDVANVLPFVVQIWMFLTPVIYPAKWIESKYQWLYFLNPMASLISGFRASLLGTPLMMRELMGAFCLCAVVFALGLWVFNRLERQFADVL